MLKNILYLLLFLSSPILFAQNTDSLLTSVFATNALSPTDQKNYNFTKAYSPNASTWAISKIFSDSIVFQAEMKYQHPVDPAKSYQMRIGKGGQIYSLRGAFGESIPPQYRKPKRVDGKLLVNASAPWIDEVWQMVAVDSKQNDRKNKEKYFIHQGGVYLKNAEQKAPFYSPLIAEFHDAKTQSYRVVNWGQQAHTADNITAKYTSDILYYTSYTNLGNGIVQVDGMLYNFGKDNINHINMPWGGVRISSLEHFFISNPDGTYTEKVDRFANKSAQGKLANTDGWMVYSGDKTGNAPAFGMVFGKDKKKNKVGFRYGYAGKQLKNNPRDYNVFAITRRFKDNSISFGKSARFRYFYVVGATTEDVKNTILQNKLNSLIIEDTDTPRKKEVAEIHYQVTKKKGTLLVFPTESPEEDALSLRAQPYADSYPLFLMKSNDGRTVITSNQYYFSDLPYDGKLQEMKLLGFGDKRYDLFLLAFAEPQNTIEPNWESMAENYQIPEWFQDGKIGVWMHWGVSSAIDETRPRDGSHYGRWMYGSENLMPPAKNNKVAKAVDRLSAWHIEKFGPLSEFGYEDFIDDFKAENFDADAIVKFAKECGARFIMPVATHHDNFDMYDSSFPWNAVDMGPKRDVLQEWKDAAYKYGLKFGVSTHLYWSPGFFNGARKYQTPGTPEWTLFNMDYDPKNFGNQDTWNEHWYERSWELIEKYDPDMFNNDSPYPLIGENKGKGLGVKLFSEFINRDLEENDGKQTTVLSFKNPKENKAAFTYNLERGMFGEIQKHPWMWATDISGNWFYRKNAFTKMSTSVLIGNAIDAISKNGVVMINLALKGDGTLPENQASVLKEFGDWVNVNAEGIYDTRPWRIYGEGPLEILSKRGGENLKEYSNKDIRFTQKENTLFAFVLAKPTDDIQIMTLKEGGLLKEKIKKISLLGNKKCIKWSRDDESLIIRCPKNLKAQSILVFKLELK